MKVKHADMIKLAENGEFDVIVHWCNCECIMGSMAEQIKKAFPGSYKADCGTDAWDSSKIGGLSIAKVKVKNNKRLVIVNAYTQLLADGNVNFHALRDVMKQVQQNFYGQRIGLGLDTISHIFFSFLILVQNLHTPSISSSSVDFIFYYRPRSKRPYRRHI